MQSDQIKAIFKSFAGKNVLVIGDVMIDSYIKGRVDRMSPEAPVPVVTVVEKSLRLGGAANVALNIQALGAHPLVFAVTGDDENGKHIQSLFVKNKLSTAGLLRIKKRPTTVKTRIITNDHHMLRLDEETDKVISAADEKILLRKISSAVLKQTISVIIFEDYDKGGITPLLIKEVSRLAVQRKIPVAVDPKKRNFLAYNGVTLFKPNLKELKAGLSIKDINPLKRAEIEKASEKLRKKLNAGMVLLTLSENGMYVTDGKNKHHIAAHPRKITDVSGAGDTVIAVAAMCLAVKAGMQTMAELANLAGGLVCEKVGVVPVDKKQLLREALRNA